VVNPLIRHAAFRVAHQLGRRILVLAVGLAALCSFVLALTDPAMTGNGAGVSRAYASVVWLEFALISVFALVEGGASIADERRRGRKGAVGRAERPIAASPVTSLSGSTITHR
jgi:hypothetical protein